MATNNRAIRTSIEALQAAVPIIQKVEKLLGRICVEMEHEQAAKVERLLEVEMRKVMTEWSDAMDRVGKSLPAAEKALGLAGKPVQKVTFADEMIPPGHAAMDRAQAAEKAETLDNEFSAQEKTAAAAELENAETVAQASEDPGMTTASIAAAAASTDEDAEHKSETWDDI